MSILHRSQVLHETIRNLQTQLLTNKARETEVNNKISELEAKLKEANVKELLLKTKIASASTSATKSNRDSISSSSGKGSDCETEDIKPCEITTERKSLDISSHDSDNEKPVKKLKIEHYHEALPQNEINNQQPVPLHDKSNIINNNNLHVVATTKSQSINLVEAKIIGLASTYLAIHPNGARLFDIWTYVNNLLPNLKLHELNEILVRYGNLFEASKCSTNHKVNNNLLAHGEEKWKFVGFAEAHEEGTARKSIKSSIEVAITNEL